MRKPIWSKGSYQIGFFYVFLQIPAQVTEMTIGDKVLLC